MFSIQPEDFEIQKVGTVAYIGFSCYMFTVSTTDKNAEMTGRNQIMVYLSEIF